MPSNFTQTQRDLLSNVRQAVALIDKELQRIREQRIVICQSGFELDWQLTCIGAMQSPDGPNKLGSMINAHTDFQATLKEIHGTHPQASFNHSSGSDRPSLKFATSTPGRSVEALAEAAVAKALGHSQ